MPDNEPHGDQPAYEHPASRRPSTAEGTVDQARVPHDPEILFGLARLAADRGDHARAVSLYERALGADVSNAFTSLDPGILGDKTLHNMALSKMALGDWPGARDDWERGLAMGGRPGLALALLEAALEAGDLNVIRRLLAWAERSEGGRGEMRKRMAERCASEIGL